MRKIKNWLVSLLLICPFVTFAQVSFGQPEKINENWKFTLNDVKGGEATSLDDSEWQKINLPHDWSVKEQLSPTLASCTGYLPGGIGWYRNTINIPASKEGEKIYLYFEGVYNRSEVFVNGQSVGSRPNGYISFMFDATPYIQYGKDNVIAVRVDHSQSADSRWYTGSGIYRNVWLVYANPTHIAQWGVYAYPKNVSKKQATLSIEVEIENESKANSSLTINNELFSAAGKRVAVSSKKLNVPAGQKGKITADMKVSNPQLWDLENPNLYKLKTTVSQDGKIIDETTTTTGFRSFTFDPNKGFALNGNWMKMKGVCLHHDAGVLGAAVPREVWKRRILTLKEIGCNAIRTSHNPQAPDLYELCDELGMLVLNEAFDEWVYPKRKWIEGWNVGTPGFQGTYDIFKMWGEQDLADMVRRDRNYVSVFAWSIGNEVDYPNDPYSHPILGGMDMGFTQAIYGGYRKDSPDANELGVIAKKLVAAVKQYDKSRSTTAALAGVAMSNETEYPGAVDIAGYNYTENRYALDHKTYPARVIYGSENRHDMAAWKAVTDNEFIFGQFLWTGADYLGESAPWPARGSSAGLLNFGSFIKPRGYFRQSLWSHKPMAYLGTYPTPKKDSQTEELLSIDAWSIWNYEEGQSIRVVCYTNADKARLELNGKIVGQLKNYDDETGIIFWDIPFQKGKLEVVGLDKNGVETTRYAIQSSKQPYALTVQTVETTICKNRGLAQIIIQVVDEDGIPVMLSDNEITCQITGPGVLLGLEAGNNRDMSDYTDNVQRAYHGCILAYIEATGEAGQMDVRFTSPWLKSVETSIIIK